VYVVGGLSEDGADSVEPGCEEYGSNVGGGVDVVGPTAGAFGGSGVREGVPVKGGAV
jgi:hypothetical protein